MAYHAPAAAHPDAAALQVLAGVMSGGGGGRGGRGGGGGGQRTPHQGAGGQQEGGERQHACAAAARSRPARSVGHVEQRSIPRGSAQDRRRDPQGHRHRTAHEGRSGPREDAPGAQSGTAVDRRAAGGHGDDDAGVAGRLAADVPAARSHTAGHARGPGARGQGLHQGFQPDGGRLHSRRRAGPRRGARHAGTGAAVHEFQEQHRGVARRRVRPDAGQHRKARGALEAGQRHEGGHAAQEDGGRYGIGGDRTALRRCQNAGRPQRRGAACRQPADERDQDQESPADPG